MSTQRGAPKLGRCAADAALAATGTFLADRLSMASKG
jgi:hypothetical protein